MLRASRRVVDHGDPSLVFRRYVGSAGIVLQSTAEGQSDTSWNRDSARENPEVWLKGVNRHGTATKESKYNRPNSTESENSITKLQHGAGCYLNLRRMIATE